MGACVPCAEEFSLSDDPSFVLDFAGAVRLPVLTL